MIRTQHLATLVLGSCIALLDSSSAHAQSSILGWGWDPHGAVSLIPDGSDYTSVSGGGTKGVALRTDGSLVVWGGDANGGDFYGLIANAPAGGGFQQAALGQSHGLAMRADNSLVSWGNDAQNLVSGTPGGTLYTQISAGAGHSVAIRTNTQLVAWGSDADGQVSGKPTGSGFIQVASGARASVALRSDGTLVVWGDDTHELVSNAPTGGGFTQVGLGFYQGVALRSDGSIVSWGDDAWGGAVTGSPTGTGFVSVDAGFSSLALHSDGSITVWGSGTPSAVENRPPGNEYTAIAASHGGAYFAMRASTPGNPYCFGDGTGAACPCSNLGNPGTGCGVNGSNPELIGFGNPQISADTFGLYVRGVAGSPPGLLLQGTTQLNGGLGVQVGHGLLCVGQTSRSHVQIVSNSGGTTFLDFQGAPFGASSAGIGVPTNYQFWFRDNYGTCGPNRFNFSNAWTVNWMP